MNDIAQVWEHFLPKEEDLKKPAGYRRGYLLKVLAILKKYHPDLYAGKEKAMLNEKSAKKLVQKLKQNKPAHIFKHQISFLCSGLEKGKNDLNWDVVIPDPPVVIARDKPRFTHENFKDLELFREIEKAYLEDLAKPPPESSLLKIGQILLSAVLYGGLVQKRWLIPWIEALVNPQLFNTSLWLDMSYSWKHRAREEKLKAKQESNLSDDTIFQALTKDAHVKTTEIRQKNDWQIQRRWFADPLSHILILRWQLNSSEYEERSRHVSPNEALREYLKRILPGRKNISGLSTKLFSLGATHLSLGTAPFLISIAEGHAKSISLHPRVWQRILSGKQIAEEEIVSPEETTPQICEQLSLTTPENVASPAEQSNMLRKIQSEIIPKDSAKKLTKDDTKKALDKFYTQHKDQLCPVLACLIQWGIDLLTYYNKQDLLRGRVKNAVRPSSVRTYLDTIGNKLLMISAGEDFINLEGDELHDIYAEVISLCRTQKSQHRAGNRLKAFHAFLVERVEMEPVDFSDITTSADPDEANVNANILSPDEFDAIKKVLALHQKAINRYQKILLLVAILGYRCGLRRSEVRKLRLIDIQGREEPELLIRNNRYAYVKSNDSIRRLPLSCLLEPNELELLLDWKRDRQLEDVENDKHSLLFCTAKEPTIMLPEKELFEPVQKAMRQVTGDRSLRFHHLRHSFATWLTLRLLKDFTEEEKNSFPFLQHKIFDKNHCWIIRKNILGNHQMGRQVLFAVAQLCGHSTPSVTLLHYFHLSDWLLSLELKRPENQPNLNASTIMALTGLPQHVVYYAHRIEKTDKWSPSTFISRLEAPKHCHISLSSRPWDTKPLPENDKGSQSDISLWRRVEAVLYEWQASKSSYSTLANRSGFTEETVKDWCDTADAIMKMKTLRGGPRHLNSTWKKNSGLRFPPHPRETVDKKLAVTILKVHQNLPKTKRHLLAWGLNYFLKNYAASKVGVPIKNTRSAQKYLSFLSLLNIPKERVRIIETIAFSNVQPAGNIDMSNFMATYGLKTDQLITKIAHPNEQSKIGNLQIRVTKSETESNKENYGYRFAIYLISILIALDITH